MKCRIQAMNKLFLIIYNNVMGIVVQYTSENYTNLFHVSGYASDPAELRGKCKLIYIQCKNQPY